jgi:arginase
MPVSCPPAVYEVALIGVPTDIGASVRGASMGPDALRVAGISLALAAQDLMVHDVGNLAGPGNPESVAQDGYRHLPEVIAWNHLVFDAVLSELQAQRLPILMGGDHCIAIGSISAVAQHCANTGKKLRVIWLDAHADANTAQLTPTGNMHGMPVACLFGQGPSALTHMAGNAPALQVEQFVQIGLRSVDQDEKRMVRTLGYQAFDMRAIDEQGMREVMRQALAGLDADTHLHLSLDVDFLDPDIAPGVGTPVRGGPNFREAQLCMEMIADSGRLASLDIAELNPACDVRSTTALLVVDLLGSLFGKSTLIHGADQDYP